MVPIGAIEEDAGITPEPGQFHHNFFVTTERLPRWYFQHFVDNKQAGVLTDMTRVCTLPGLVDEWVPFY